MTRSSTRVPHQVLKVKVEKKSAIFLLNICSSGVSLNLDAKQFFLACYLGGQ